MSEGIDVCGLSEVHDGVISVFRIGGAEICLTSHQGTPLAFAADCTHRRCEMRDAEIDDGVIICPCHGAEFDAATGEVLLGPATEPLPVYAISVDGERVRVVP